ncbi:hypothetical protein D3C85_1754940 [compost metagenome]
MGINGLCAQLKRKRKRNETMEPSFTAFKIDAVCYSFFGDNDYSICGYRVFFLRLQDCIRDTGANYKLACSFSRHGSQRAMARSDYPEACETDE